MQQNKTAQLLISGGDERLALNTQGVNKYGCRPTPDDEVLAFSSSTATPISSSRFSMADNLRMRFEQENFSVAIHEQEITRQKSAWRELIGLDNETPLIFSPSGTDLHRLVSNSVNDNTLIIMPESNETGSGVAAALAQERGVNIVAFSLRFANGLPRPISDIDNEVTSLIEKGISENRDILLIIVDQSKTGMIAPSPHCAITLKNTFEKHLTVLVDACQFRLSATTLNAYSKQNFIVALTGSKFLTAPSFSAMLILPPTIKFSAELEKPNFGLLLRMEIALQEYRAFSFLTAAQIQLVILTFAEAVQTYLKKSPHFDLLEVPDLNRDGLVQNSDWDDLPTIFPFFLLRHQKPLSPVETFAVYQKLPQQNTRCQIGQPVFCGNEKSALRLCLSAPLIVNAAQSEAHLDDCIEKALRVLKTIETVK